MRDSHWGAAPDREATVGRVSVSGKFFTLGGKKWYVKGLTYGPFAPGSHGLFLPERDALRRDFAQIRSLGANCVRVYHRPPAWVLDAAVENGLRVFVDVPWEKHRCFFEDWSAQQHARDEVRRVAHELGSHPGLFALSVANEFPNDIVRFYGRRRMARFVDELLDSVKQEAPDCLATFANFPSTEFLQPTGGDFVCFNVYLEREESLAAYLDRLQHMAGPRPLILGEFGMDTIRNGEEAQTAALTRHVETVFRHGLAGSFVFSYTDDWFTGGHQIDDWAFGVTRRDRSEKPAATAVRRAWAAAPRFHDGRLPKVTVVVCSYNGARTLRECLESLEGLNYPSYEVILVDDGSTDCTRDIAADFPSARYIHQENRGLSVARNVGAEAATGEVVAYTDSDCVADPDWLDYLVDAMRRQGVKAIGGPNLPPPDDSWTAACVAASPGGPSHVMLDDRRAEHVPGCNMAFDRETLLGMGGFDPQFRQAGDDVDICWRLLDLGHTIGYSASALVWHHRRNTVRAYLKQQKGYGRSEAMLIAKHPRRFNRLGASLWKGVIYGEGAVGLPLVQPVVYHGRFGTELFQTIYTRNEYSAWGTFTLIEWHALAAAVAVLGIVWPLLMAVVAAMWTMTLVSAARSMRTARLPAGAPWWCRPVVFGLHIAQPVVRALHRYRQHLGSKRLPAIPVQPGECVQRLRRVGRMHDAYWMSQDYRGREDLLHALEAEAKRARWRGIFDEGWVEWDVLLLGDRWYSAKIRTATEELGWPRRFTRARVTPRTTLFARVILAACTIAGVAACAASATHPVALLGCGLAMMVLYWRLWFSRRQLLRKAEVLLGRAGRAAGLEAYNAAKPGRRRRLTFAPIFRSVPHSPEVGRAGTADVGTGSADLANAGERR